MKNDIRNWQETETETERIVNYDTDKAHITVHIPKRTPEEQAEYEKKMRAALRRFHYHVTVERGYDWDELVAKHEDDIVQLTARKGDSKCTTQ